jgi:hypothetical protein
MISVDSLLYGIDQKLNKLSSSEHQNISLVDKILVLNNAQIKLIKNKMSGINVPSGVGFDGFRRRHEDLQNLVVDYTSLDLSAKNDKLNQWTADLSELSPKYMFYIDSYVLADKGNCKDKIIWVNQDLSKHADTSILLKNDNYKPSFEYQETFNLISSEKISIFTDGTFAPTKLYIMYLRYPLYIDKEGYIDFEGNPSVNQDCELNDYLESELLNLAIEEIAMSTENISAVQSSRLRIQTNE